MASLGVERSGNYLGYYVLLCLAIFDSEVIESVSSIRTEHWDFHLNSEHRDGFPPIHSYVDSLWLYHHMAVDHCQDLIA